jgi:cytochrome c biogenesis protein CcmG, thiol:disulfide interchange protein DsbE
MLFEMVTDPVSRRRFLARAALTAGCAGLWPRVPARANDLHVGTAAPPATLVTLDGQRISTADLVGHVVILTFWATWCPPCRDELPLLSSFAAERSAQGLSVLGFSLDTSDRLSDVQRIAQTLSFPVGLLSAASVPGYGRIWRLPVNFTIDRAGNLIDNGWKDANPAWTQARLEEVVTPLLHQ